MKIYFEGNKISKSFFDPYHFKLMIKVKLKEWQEPYNLPTLLKNKLGLELQKYYLL